MFRVLLLVGIVVLFGACTSRLVCPAYQSSFIHDKEAVRQKFSYFKEDSTPKVYTASKGKYLVAVPESYRKKYRKMQTVEMTPVYSVIADSLKEQDQFLLAESDATDSLASAQAVEPGDSAYAITKTKEKYNLDQDLYMWYFREMLVLPDVRAAMEKKKAEKEGPKTTGKKEKKGIKGFFQNLFKKKPKNDSTAAVTPPATSDVKGEEPPRKKRGGVFKKKTQDALPKKKEDGDGF